MKQTSFRSQNEATLRLKELQERLNTESNEVSDLLSDDSDSIASSEFVLEKQMKNLLKDQHKQFSFKLEPTKIFPVSRSKNNLLMLLEKGIKDKVDSQISKVCQHGLLQLLN